MFSPEGQGGEEEREKEKQKQRMELLETIENDVKNQVFFFFFFFLVVLILYLFPCFFFHFPFSKKTATKRFTFCAKIIYFGCKNRQFSSINPRKRGKNCPTLTTKTE